MARFNYPWYTWPARVFKLARALVSSFLDDLKGKHRP